MKLTKRQAEILAFLKEWIEQHGYPPTRAEISQALGFRSPNAAEDHLRALARKQAIEMIPGASRGIRIIEDELTAAPDLSLALNDHELPIIGQVAAGQPILAQEHIETTCAISPDFFKPKADYLLRVKGSSMQDIGILDGDLLAVHKTQQAKNGDIVVARIDNEVTVKRFKREGNTVWLIAENQDFAPIEIDLSHEELVIEGLSVGVIRH
ncbi:LexA family transcriptional regulator [Thiopseudomonas alkaliphila]|uniref:LexA repressor n=1 Tax=Thiopseudomonas alkaliphila TaxID=1697053 RepID=A0AAW7DQV9_9GAMM|nr:transcriptional repressor LexA [Thiopseudomonas alkaliphila]AKX46397.1 LexA family transcriptional regulator [Thiopseudomonas alkaliphila]AKX49468.1 LexA family transcriptional regulator [Thiopseudomonas alkaliphila]AKX50221.1 LexA family transcriptional regulator [Thiopseudomonas alkaliphila]AKX52623.1 LexA family transcriptional regulator [Thiopseudomonas alkaliphila]AKX54470.1 LexA family transcriptional regulator [Thiopseudomonas alkaliphila]